MAERATMRVTAARRAGRCAGRVGKASCFIYCKKQLAARVARCRRAGGRIARYDQIACIFPVVYRERAVCRPWRRKIPCFFTPPPPPGSRPELSCPSSRRAPAMPCKRAPASPRWPRGRAPDRPRPAPRASAGWCPCGRRSCRRPASCLPSGP